MPEIQFNEEDVKQFNLTEADKAMAQKFIEMVGGGEPVKLEEFLATPSAQVLMPRVIVGAMREVAEPMYIGTSLLSKIRLNSGNAMTFPTMTGGMRAAFIAEGQDYPEQGLEGISFDTPEVRVQKAGIKLGLTEEMINDSQWDVMSMMIREAGRAMARLKEEQAFNQFSKHGHTVFDNAPDAPQEARTRGLDIDGTPNETLSAEDFLDLIIAVMNNGFNPSDILIHPLSWSVFAKNELFGAIAKAPYDNYPSKGAPSNIALGPDSIAGRLPFAFNVQTSPFIPFDKKAKKFDMYVLDRNNVGVLLVKEELSTDQFDNPARDIYHVKIKERYGIGVMNQGKAIAVAKNISMNNSFNEPVRTKIVQG